MKKIYMFLPLALIMGFIAGCQDRHALTELDAMKAQAELEEQNKAIVLRWLNEVSKSNFDSLYEELFAKDSKQYIPPNADPLSFEEYKPMAQHIYKAFPEIAHTVDEYVEVDQIVKACEGYQAIIKEFLSF